MEMMENITLDCENGVPNVFEFVTGLSYIHRWILVMPTGFYLMTITLFILNLCIIIKYGQKETKSNVLILVTLYPVSNNLFSMSIFLDLQKRYRVVRKLRHLENYFFEPTSKTQVV
jgi:hypothetical protein